MPSIRYSTERRKISDLKSIKIGQEGGNAEYKQIWKEARGSLEGSVYADMKCNQGVEQISPGSHLCVITERSGSPCGGREN